MARLIANKADADFRELSATSSGSADVRKVFEQARNQLKLLGRRTVLFIGKHPVLLSTHLVRNGLGSASGDVELYHPEFHAIDEIHRFTKPQQDLFLPFVETGSVTLIGATTENPSFKGEFCLDRRCVLVLNTYNG
jgi:putative ATPase